MQNQNRIVIFVEDECQKAFAKGTLQAEVAKIIAMGRKSGIVIDPDLPPVDPSRILYGPGWSQPELPFSADD